MSRIAWTVGLLFVIFCAATPAHALVVRTEGQVYTIKERDLLDVIHERIAAMDMDALQDKLQDLLFEQVKTYRLPDSVSDLPIATKERLYRVDLTYTVPQDITDLRGTVLYPAGYQFNPLTVMAEQGLTYPFMLVIINGARKAEREWFVHSAFDNPRVKLLVTDGYPYQLAEELKRPVYQLTGLIQERFRIEETPTIVFWPLHSDYLAVRTVPVPEAAEEESAHEPAAQ